MLLALVFIVSGCRQLDIIQENDTQNNHLKVSVIKNNEILKNSLLFDKVSTIQNKNFFRSLTSKTIQDSVLEGAIISTESAMLVENGENKTYTFSVIRSSNHSMIENLVLKQKPDNTFSGVLIQYNISLKEKELFVSGHDVDLKNKIKIFDINNLNIDLNARVQTDAIGCYAITWETGWCSEGVHYSGNDGGCVVGGAPNPTIISIVNNCGGGSDTGDNGGNPSYPGGNTYPGDGSQSGGGYDTAPYSYTEAELIEMNKAFRLKLNSTQLSWYDSHFILGMDLAKLYNTDKSIQHLNFLKSVIEYMKTSTNVQDTLLYASIISFLREEGSYQENWTLINNIFTEHNPTLGIAVLNFIKENPDTLNKAEIINRIKALDNALAQNPNLLLDIPCNKLDDWKPMADHQIPQSVKDKLKNINTKTHWYQDDLIIQNLDNAQGKSLNMDLFTVKISNLPNKPGTTQKFTAKEFFDYFRLHLNDFAETFTPVVDTDLGVNDTALWNSTNPLNALISIYIPVIVGHNNGTVICSGVTSNTWVFTTITSPWDSEHPVSGNRFFSYFMNPNDNAMYIYTRGLDRVNLPIFNNLSPNNNPAFNGADELWSSMQAKIKKFVKDNGGGDNGATIMSPEIYRPDWAKVKDYLRGNKPLSSLGCK